MSMNLQDANRLDQASFLNFQRQKNSKFYIDISNLTQKYFDKRVFSEHARQRCQPFGRPIFWIFLTKFLKGNFKTKAPMYEINLYYFMGSENT